MKKFYLLFITAVISVLSFGQTVIINEILANPANNLTGDANGDGVRHATNDEFIEIYNSGSTSINIENYTLSDANSVRHIFPSGTILPANSFITVFGGGTPTGISGLVQTASTPTLSLNDAGDTVTLKDDLGTTITTISYGSEGGDSQSIGLDPDFTGSFVKHSTITGNGGALFSPGEKNDGSTLSVVKNQIENFAMYPNPVSNGMLYMSSSINLNKQVEIYAFTGQQVYSKNLQTQEPLNISNLHRGIYIVRIEEEGKIATRKLVVN